jgi:hypothetical protein
VARVLAGLSPDRFRAAVASSRRSIYQRKFAVTLDRAAKGRFGDPAFLALAQGSTKHQKNLTV